MTVTDISKSPFEDIPILRFVCKIPPPKDGSRDSSIYTDEFARYWLRFRYDFLAIYDNSLKMLILRNSQFILMDDDYWLCVGDFKKIMSARFDVCENEISVHIAQEE